MISQAQQELIADNLAQFAATAAGMKILSTGARPVDHFKPLYNVIGSTPDPHIDRKNWMSLLKSYGISGDCFADTPVPRASTSHPTFGVGGHMTPNSDGSVEFGGICYLMPLCKWHNGKGNNGKPFEHAQTRILELSGYMQGELSATFMARMSGEMPFSLVFVGANGATFRNLDDDSARAADAFVAAKTAVGPANGAFVLLRRHSRDGEEFYTVEDAAR